MSEQGKLVGAWTGLLPILDTVRFLWLSSRATQSLFESACAMPSLEGLYIKWGGIKDLTPLLTLGTLKYLHIGGSGRIQDIACLRHMDRLVVLELEGFVRVSSLEPIADLTQLEGLAVEGSIWTTQIVDSLRPLAKLTSLKYLFLANLRSKDNSKDNSLKPLAELVSLVHLRTAYWWPEEEFSKLRKSLPCLEYGSLFDQELIARFAKKGRSARGS
jgi:hypothetical protein